MCAQESGSDGKEVLRGSAQSVGPHYLQWIILGGLLAPLLSWGQKH